MGLIQVCNESIHGRSLFCTSYSIDARDRRQKERGGGEREGRSRQFQLFSSPSISPLEISSFRPITVSFHHLHHGQFRMDIRSWMDISEGIIWASTQGNQIPPFNQLIFIDPIESKLNAYSDSIIDVYTNAPFKLIYLLVVHFSFKLSFLSNYCFSLIFFHLVINIIPFHSFHLNIPSHLHILHYIFINLISPTCSSTFHHHLLLLLLSHHHFFCVYPSISSLDIHPSPSRLHLI